MTDLAGPMITQQLFESIEKTYGIAWVKMVVAAYDDAVSNIGQAAEFAENFVDIPDGVKVFAEKLHLSLQDPVALAKKLLPKWASVRSLVSQALVPFLQPIVQPMLGVLLRQFPEIYEDNVREALVHSGKLLAFQAVLKEKLDGVLDSVEKL